MLGKLFLGGGDPIKEFWDWFVKNQDEIYTIETGEERIFGQVMKRLRRVHPSLVMQGGVNQEVQELEISADGDKAAFPAVQALVAAAPQLPRFKFHAFRQRSANVDRIEMNGLQLSIDQMFYLSERKAKSLDIWIYIEGLTEDRREMLAGAAFVLLDALVGEYDVETKIDGIDFFPLSSYTGPLPLRPLRDLQSEIDALKGA